MRHLSMRHLLAAVCLAGSFLAPIAAPLTGPLAGAARADTCVDYMIVRNSYYTGTIDRSTLAIVAWPEFYPEAFCGSPDIARIDIAAEIDHVAAESFGTLTATAADGRVLATYGVTVANPRARYFATGKSTYLGSSTFFKFGQDYLLTVFAPPVLQSGAAVDLGPFSNGFRYAAVLLDDDVGDITTVDYGGPSRLRAILGPLGCGHPICTYDYGPGRIGDFDASGAWATFYAGALLPVPVPAALPLALGALACLVALRRKRLSG